MNCIFCELDNKIVEILPKTTRCCIPCGATYFLNADNKIYFWRFHYFYNSIDYVIDFYIGDNTTVIFKNGKKIVTLSNLGVILTPQNIKQKLSIILVFQ